MVKSRLKLTQPHLFIPGLMLTVWMFMSGLVFAAQPPANWQALTPAQQNILASVQKEWPTMSALQRRRLLALAAKYPALKPEQQQRFQKRLTVWSALTPAQRNQARKNYQKLKKLPKNKRQQIKHQLMQVYGKPKAPVIQPVLSPDSPATPPARTIPKQPQFH